MNGEVGNRACMLLTEVMKTLRRDKQIAVVRGSRKWGDRVSCRGLGNGHNYGPTHTERGHLPGLHCSWWLPYIIVVGGTVWASRFWWPYFHRGNNGSVSACQHWHFKGLGSEVFV